MHRYWTDPEGSDVAHLMYAWNAEHTPRELPRTSSWESATTAASSEQEGLSPVAELGGGALSPRLTRSTSWMNQSGGFFGGTGGGVPVCRSCGAQGALALGNPDSPGAGMRSLDAMRSQAGGSQRGPPGAKQVDNKRLVFVAKLASGASGSVDKYK